LKKTELGLSLILILTLLLSYTVVFVDLATANPAPLFPFPQEPITTPPTIVMYSPVQNETYDSPHVLLNFIVIKPEAWFPSVYDSSVENAISHGDVFGNVTSVYYVVDSGERQNITVHDVDSLFNGNPPPTLSFSTTLNLTAGAHNVKISVEADSYYYVGLSNGYNLSSVVVHGDSEPVNFTVALPEPVIVVPENITYNESSVPLAFTVGTSATSWVGYSLDGKDNVTIDGNTTLTGLSNGAHNVTVYANDTFGNVGSSQTITFTIALVSIVKSEPFPTAIVVVVLAVVAVVVVAGLLVYFKKRKR
jgi:hypothetical protein